MLGGILFFIQVLIENIQANSSDPDDGLIKRRILGLHCLPYMSHKKDAMHIWVTNAIILLSHKSSRTLGSRLLK